MVTINKQQIKDFDACEDGLHRFITATDNTNTDVCVIDLISTDVTTDDLLWLAGKLSPKKKIVQFAVDCAESVVHLSKQKELSQNCIDAAKAVIENNNETNRKAACAAATAAAAAGVAGAAAATAHNAAAAAAHDSARYVGGYRATRAAARAARVDINFDVNPLLVKLFTK